MKKIIVLLFVNLLCVHFCNAQELVPKAANAKYGYVDRLGNWVIQPQYDFAGEFNDGLAVVGFSKRNNIENGYNHVRGLIDVNGDVVISIKNGLGAFYTTQPSTDGPIYHFTKLYSKGRCIVDKRNARGKYNDFYATQTKITQQLDSLAQIKIREEQLAAAERRRMDSLVSVKKQMEKQRQDSILMAQRQLKLRVDSIVALKKFHADSIWLAREHKINIEKSSGAGISLKKIKITGDGLLLRKDKNYRTYSITRDDYNRYHIAHDGDVAAHGVLDVKKVIYESDLRLLSDDLFHSIEIAKVTANISRGGRTQNFGALSFLVTLNLDDLNATSSDEKVVLTVLKSISQVESYITSFKNDYQNAAHFVEPLIEVMVSIADKQGNGASIEEVKRICNEAKQKLAAQK